MTKLKVEVLIRFADAVKSAVFRGQEAKTLLALVRAGQGGVTAQEISSWALRLSAYVMQLRRAGLEIETRREQHPGGWHGRYVLHSKVRVKVIGDTPSPTL